ncbi:Uncharacterized protein BP5553_06085 [Venustampulla echinocandica]|uniref:P-loop containing nucleoside triphosphate hydrolase n=1 Tax=Venustampulla echinocandica TaxID=2656787 RepID=A0A370TMH6_9HELO|nr:Uncharacterized protein BP5553_06085 [Venustampulla echinocandica]RDL36733.1 Uncharacterized protein BP5553_06085 [Venustampulla echinocandica]
METATQAPVADNPIQTPVSGQSSAGTLPRRAKQSRESKSRTQSTPEQSSSTTTPEKAPVSEPITLLADDPFNSKESKLLFDAIDELRECRVGQELDLPQLVIVGQQSAGKSSLLQSLTDIPFPVGGGGLCTRFATRIISRRTEPGTSDDVQISIKPGDIDPFGYQGDETNSGNFSFSIPTMTTITTEIFEDVVKKATKHMGILAGEGPNRKNFSSNVLEIELSGPNRSHFGILDVPGVFDAILDEKTITEEEMAGVRAMVTSYMRKPENIIICVAPANEDLSNQTIANLIRLEKINPSRVIGVFTKCDRADSESAEETVQVAKGIKGLKLDNGWFVVQNRSKDGPTSGIDREDTERTTLSKHPWVEIPHQRRGTAMLKKFLASILCRRIREAFPGLRIKIMALLAAEKQTLARLGNPRPELYDQRKYLNEIVVRYHDLAHQALKSPEELPSDTMKLRGMVRQAAKTFATEMRINGNLYEFLEIGDSRNALEQPLKSSQNSLPSIAANKKRSIYHEIRAQIGKNQGEELEGLSNPAILKPLFRKQTEKWQELAQNHLRSIISMSQDVASMILDQVCAELGVPSHTANDLGDIISGFKDDAEQRATLELHTFCHEITTFPLQTSNPLYLEKVTKAQHLRFQGALERYRTTNPVEKFITTLLNDNNPQYLPTIPQHYKSWVIVDVNNLDELFKQMHPRGVQNTENEIHDLLKAYYEIALEDFLSHITGRIVEPFLQDKHGPVLGLSSDYISGFSEERIEMLGGEDRAVIEERKAAEKQIKKLEDAMRIADQTWRRTKELEK